MENKEVYDEISSIKNIMERSTRFISLSGLSGVMAGIYALIGSWLAYNIIPEFLKPYVFIPDDKSGKELFNKSNVNYLFIILLIAAAVLLLSIGTGIWLTSRKAHRNRQSVWNQSSRALLSSGLIPLLTGGCFIIILLWQHYYMVIAPACLIFYGLALVAASQYTYGDVKWLGLLDVILGLLALMMPAYGLLLWALGFGVLHILYGTIMYYKYDRENNAD
jgi:hypothetical protein